MAPAHSAGGDDAVILRAVEYLQTRKIRTAVLGAATSARDVNLGHKDENRHMRLIVPHYAQVDRSKSCSPVAAY